MSTLETILLRTKFGQCMKDEYTYHLYYKSYKHMRKLMINHSPEVVLRSIWGKCMKYPLNLNNPQTFNEKLQWLKLNWYDERAITCSSKYLVREYVKSKGLESILVEQLGVYTNPSEIDFKVLPSKFVLKPSHDSGHTIICTDKSKLNIRKVRRKLKRWLSINYEFMSGEWPYKSKKYIVCEKFLEDEKVGELLDYKFFCFNGKPEIIFFVSDRIHHARSDFYSLEWNLLPFRWIYEPSGRVFPKPSKLNEMIAYAKVLSEGFPFVRVDFYQVGERVYFGELTFFHGGGLGGFQPESIDFELGSLLILPQRSDPWSILLSKMNMQKN